MAKAPVLPECLQKIAEKLPQALEGLGAIGFYVSELGGPVPTQAEETMFQNICEANGLVATFRTLPEGMRYTSITRKDEPATIAEQSAGL